MTNEGLFKIGIHDEFGEPISGLYVVNSLPFEGQIILVGDYRLTVLKVVLDLRNDGCIYQIITRLFEVDTDD